MKTIKFIFYLFILTTCQKGKTTFFIKNSWETYKDRKIVLDTTTLNYINQKYDLKDLPIIKFNYLPVSVILTNKNKTYGIKKIIPYIEIIKDTFSIPVLIIGIDMYRGPENFKVLIYDSLPLRYIDLVTNTKNFDMIKKVSLPYNRSFTYGKFKIKELKNKKTWFSGISILKKDFEILLNKFHPKGVWILIRKSDFTLFLYKNNKLLKKFKVSIGKNEGDKQKVGDMRTPEGFFYITQIQDSHTWVHDFKDGKGPIKGAYGPWFLRLYTDTDATFSEKRWTGIGIHGTHDPSSIGMRNSEGCIRLKNEDILILHSYVKRGTSVFIVK